MIQLRMINFKLFDIEWLALNSQIQILQFQTINYEWSPLNGSTSKGLTSNGSIL